MYVIFAPVVSTGFAVYLKQLTIDHHRLFKELYPGKNLVPKDHFMVHYPGMMVQFGPLSRLWCMKFEAKHNPLKTQAHVVCNFKNVSKTHTKTRFNKCIVAGLANHLATKCVFQMHFELF